MNKIRIKSVHSHWVGANVLLAMMYFLTGYLGSLLATPPGFATAIWPPSGIALACVLVFGWRVLWGVGLGSLAINITLTMQMTGLGLFALNWFVPLMIALGAMAQAWVGALLIRRYVNFPTGLDDVVTVIKTLFLGGLVATLVNATWSVLILHQTGVVSTERWLENWATWWIGDSIGVLVFAPLVLVWTMPEPFYHRRRAITVSSTLGIAFTLTIFGFLLVAQLERNDRVGRFQAASHVAVAQIERQFSDYEEFSHLVRSFFNGSEVVLSTEFYAFVYAWLLQHPEVQAVEWAPLISHAERAAIEQQLSTQAQATITLRDRIAPNIYMTSPEQSEYVPLVYIEPLAANKIVQGYNIISDAERKTTLAFAATHNVTVMTAPTRLIQDNQQPAILLDTPVYNNHQQKDYRWQNIKGFIVMALKVNEVLQALERTVMPSELTIVVSDINSGLVLYGQPPATRVQEVAKQMGLYERALCVIGQRQWQIEVWPTQARLMSYESWLTWVVLTIGLIITSIAVSYTLISSGQRQYLERMINARTHELLERHQQLEQARVAAVAANTAKGQFLANMSHEIRTPMNAIIGFSHLLLTDNLQQKERNYIEKIDNAARHLLSIINDILDFSKIDAGRLELEKTAFDLDELIQQVTQQLALSAADKGVDFILDMTTVLSQQLIGDPLRLRQVLLNLCHNAIKFTEHGEVIIRLSTRAQTANHIDIDFHIQDTGIGIAPEQLPYLFAPFTQADNSITRRYGGTGLGLVVSKRIVTLMGGELAVDSIVNQGSVFSFSLSFALDTATDNQLLPRAPLAPLNILVVDDSARTREVLVTMLKQLSFSAVAVASGAEALQLLRQAQWTTPFDAVLLDLNMPISDGLEIARRICQEPTLATLPLLFLMSKNGYQRLQQLDNEIKFSAYLDKPISPAMLKEAMYRAFQQGEINASTASLLPTSTLLHFAPARLLLVEDNLINQKLVAEMLRRLGLSVDIVNDGQQALDTIQKSGIHYDLVLMDLQMPIMDGLTATRQLRQQYSLSMLPIIALTASAMADERQLCLDAGMNSHVAKPIEATELAVALAQFLPLAATPYAVPLFNAQEDIYSDDLQQLNQLLKRQSFDAINKFALLQPMLQVVSHRQTNEMAAAMASLDFKRARYYLTELARVIEVILD